VLFFGVLATMVSFENEVTRDYAAPTNSRTLRLDNLDTIKNEASALLATLGKGAALERRDLCAAPRSAWSGPIVPSSVDLTGQSSTNGQLPASKYY
jgi:hypothetical protein